MVGNFRGRIPSGGGLTQPDSQTSTIGACPNLMVLFHAPGQSRRPITAEARGLPAGPMWWRGTWAGGTTHIGRGGATNKSRVTGPLPGGPQYRPPVSTWRT